MFRLFWRLWSLFATLLSSIITPGISIIIVQGHVIIVDCVTIVTIIIVWVYCLSVHLRDYCLSARDVPVRCLIDATLRYAERHAEIDATLRYELLSA